VNRHLVILSAFLLSIAPAPARATTPLVALTRGDTVITLLGYHTKAPGAWSVRQPASSSRLAQFVIHGAEAASDAEVVVFFFGASQGGNVEANIGRWRSQFSTPDGSPVPRRSRAIRPAPFP